MKFLYFIYFLLFISCQLHSQTNLKDWQGDWTGVLTQDDGGYRSTYKVKLTLIQEKNEISGFFYVEEKGLKSKMQISGKWMSNTKIKLQDLRILEHEEPKNIDWCYKTYILEFKTAKGHSKLEGNWSGKTMTAPCVPGKVQLKRPPPRA